MRFCAWRRSGVLVAVAMLGVLVAPASARPGGAKKVWVDLGQGQALGINDQGVVVGSVGGFGVFRAVMWKNGVQINLGTLSRGLVECGASAINKFGHVVGNCSNRSGSTTHAFVWFRGRMRDLGTLRGSSSSVATAISNNGITAGLSTPNGAGNPHAVMWRNGVIRDLGVLGSGYVQSIGRGVNNGGQVVGWSTQSSSFEQAFRWANGRMTALRAPSGAQSEATAINNRGQVAGGLLGSGGLKPALWAGAPPSSSGRSAAMALRSRSISSARLPVGSPRRTTAVTRRCGRTGA